MKLLLALTFLISANAFAQSVEDCKKLASFEANQQAKLSLSRYSLGLITARQLDAEQAAQRQQMFAKWANCEASK
jgi:hypothetical protein